MLNLTFLAAAANAAGNAVANTAEAAANVATAAATTSGEAATEAAGNAAAAAQKNFGFFEALNQGGWVTWTIFIILVIMSGVSWYIMLTKVFEQGKVLKQSREGVTRFWSSATGAGGPRDAAGKLEKNTPFRQLVDDTLRGEEDHGKLKDPVDQHEYVLGSMQRSQNAINAKLGGGLAFLATVGSTAPFVGLLGTVIGIYRALVKIGATGDASIDKVAGPVGEALIMTAIGLIVAVPAVMGYNWLQRRNKLISERMDTFCNDLHAYLGSGGSVRPTVRTAAAPAAKPAAAPAKA